MVEKLKEFFSKHELKNKLVKFDDSMIINDSQIMVDTHIAIIETGIDNPSVKPYLLRLLKLKKILEDEKQSIGHT